MTQKITVRIEDSLRDVWEQRAMEENLSLSEFIRKSVEGELNKDTVSRNDINHLEKRIILLEKTLSKKFTNLDHNVKQAFKDFGTALGKTVGETIYQTKGVRLNSTSKRKVINAKGKWTKLELPVYEEVLRTPEKYFLEGDGLTLIRNGKTVHAIVKEFDGVNMQLVDNKSKEEFTFLPLLSKQLYESIKEHWRKI